MCMKLFVSFPYYLFWCLQGFVLISPVSLLISTVCVFSLFFVSLAKSLSILMNFSKKQVLVSFSLFFLSSISLISVLFSFFPYSCFGFILLYFSRFLRCELRVLIWSETHLDFFFFNVCIQCYKCPSQVSSTNVDIFSYSFSTMYFFLFSLRLPLWHMHYLDVHCSSQSVGDFSYIFLLLIASLFPRGLRTYFIYLIPLDLLRFVWWPMIWYILEYVSLPFEKNVDSSVSDSGYKIPQ